MLGRVNVLDLNNDNIVANVKEARSCLRHDKCSKIHIRERLRPAFKKTKRLQEKPIFLLSNKSHVVYSIAIY